VPKAGTAPAPRTTERPGRRSDERRPDSGRRQIGIGNYWRVSHELLLLGVKGGETFLQNDLRSWKVMPRGAHSAKPGDVRRMIEKASPRPRLELFARDRHDGWVVWGNEIRRDLFYPTLEEVQKGDAQAQAPTLFDGVAPQEAV
jgi:N6-adenosine-specific RNA methylase IME4